MTNNRSLTQTRRNYVWTIPIAYFVVLFLWIFVNPHDLRFPYDFWGELAKQWKRVFSGIGLLGVLWLFGTYKKVSRARANISNESAWPYLLTFVMAGFLLRILWCSLSPNMPYADGESMWNEAINLWRGNGYSIDGAHPTSYRPPGYPFLMSLIFSWRGPNLFAVKMMQAVLSTCVIALMFKVADSIFGRAVAIMTGFFVAFWPMGILSSSLIMNEHLYMILALTAILLILSDLDHPKAMKLVGAGMLLGISVLTRSVMTALPVVLILWYWYCRIPFQTIARKIILLTVPFLLVIFPWTFRNYLTMGYPVFVCTSAGHALGGNCSDAVTPYSPGLSDFAQYAPEWKNLHPNEEVAMHLGGARSAKQWIRRNPLIFMKFQAAKMVCLFGITTNWPVHDNFYSLNLGPAFQKFMTRLEKMVSLSYSLHLWLFLVGLALMAWTLWVQSDAKKVFVLLLFIYWAFLHGTFHAEKRYRYPIEPFMMMLSSYVITKFISCSKPFIAR